MISSVLAIKKRVSLASRLLSAGFTRSASPLKVNLALTYRCQYRCLTCNIWKKRPTGELSTAEVLQFITTNRRFRWADVTGGEIFLREDVEELLQAMIRDWRNLAVLHFPTNGYLTDRIVEVVERISRKNGPQIVVTVSLDGDEAVNDQIRGVQGGYRRQVATFNALRKIRGLRVVFGMTLSQHNLGMVGRTFDACATDCPGLGHDDFHLNVMQLSGHYYDNEDQRELIPTKQRVREDLAIYRSSYGPSLHSPSGWLENRFLDHLERFLASGRTPMRCHALRSSCFVDPWGIVYPCISYSRPIGNLRDHDMDLHPIWTGEEARATQSEIWCYDCPQCWTACEAYQSILGNVLRPNNIRTIGD